MFPWNGNFLEMCQPFPAWIGSDADTDITGDRIKVRDYEGVLCMVYKPAGTAGDDLRIEFQQHDAASSGNSADLIVRNVAFNLGATAITSPAGWVLAHIVTPVAAWVTDTTSIMPYFSNDANFPIGTAVADLTGDSNAAIFCVDIKAADLTSGTYGWVSMNIEGDSVDNALTTQGWYILYGAKYGGGAPLGVAS